MGLNFRVRLISEINFHTGDAKKSWRDDRRSSAPKQLKNANCAAYILQHFSIHNRRQRPRYHLDRELKQHYSERESAEGLSPCLRAAERCSFALCALCSGAAGLKAFTKSVWHQFHPFAFRARERGLLSVKLLLAYNVSHHHIVAIMLLINYEIRQKSQLVNLLVLV